MQLYEISMYSSGGSLHEFRQYRPTRAQAMRSPQGPTPSILRMRASHRPSIRQEIWQLADRGLHRGSREVQAVSIRGIFGSTERLSQRRTEPRSEERRVGKTGSAA